MVNNEIVSRIAQKIRTVRKRKKLTIQQLAQKTNVTKGLLSRIENSRTIPSLPLFVQILDSLDVSLKEFFDDMVVTNGRKFVLIQKGQYAALERQDRKGLDYKHILSQNIESSTMEVFLLTIKPGARGRTDVSTGHKFMHAVSGICELHIGNEIVSMEHGDSIYFDGSVPHLLVNMSGEDAMMFIIYFHVAKT